MTHSAQNQKKRQSFIGSLHSITTITLHYNYYITLQLLHSITAMLFTKVIFKCSRCKQCI